jgi:hypothetical protein
LALPLIKIPPPQLAGQLTPPRLPFMKVKPEMITLLLIELPVTVNTRWVLIALIVTLNALAPVRLTALFSVKLSMYMPGVITIVSPIEAELMQAWIDPEHGTIDPRGRA